MEGEEVVPPLLCVLCCGNSLSSSDLKEKDLDVFKAVPSSFLAPGGQLKSSLCQPCGSLILSTVKVKEEVTKREREVRHKQRELLQELRILEGEVNSFKEWMVRMEELIKMGKGNGKEFQRRLEDRVGSRRRRKELWEFRENVWKVVGDLRDYYVFVCGRRREEKSPPVKLERNLDTNFDEEIDSCSLEGDFLNGSRNVATKDDPEFFEEEMEDNDSDYHPPSSPTPPIKVAPQNTTSTGKRPRGRPRKNPAMTSDNQPRKVDRSPNKKDSDFKPTENSDHDDPDFEDDAPAKRKKKGSPKQPASPKRPPGRPPKDGVSHKKSSSSKGTPNYYQLRKDMESQLEGMSDFKMGVVRRVLLRAKRHKELLETPEDFDPLQGANLLKKLDREMFLDYNSDQDLLHLQNTPIFINEAHRTLDCTLCNFSSSSEFQGPGFFKMSLVDHILGQHLDSYRCPHCSAVTSSRANFTLHLRENHPAQLRIPLSCDICGKPVPDKPRLRLHKWSHLSPSEKAEAAATRKNPAKREAGGWTQLAHWPYTCDLCGKKLSTGLNLRRHRETHNPSREKVLCSGCGKYLIPTALSAHQKKCGVSPAEVSEKPFKCHLCDAAFREKVSLKGHLDSVHYYQRGVQIRVQEYREKKFLCTYCPKRFGVNLELQDHLQRHEKGTEKPFRCRKNCGKRFTRAVKRNRHEAGCNGQLKTGCGKCGKFFQNLKTHEKKCTGGGEGEGG